MEEQKEELPLPESIEVETPRGIRVRLASYRADIDHLTIRATELITFVESLNGKKEGSSYIQ